MEGVGGCCSKALENRGEKESVALEELQLAGKQVSAGDWSWKL